MISIRQRVLDSVSTNILNFSSQKHPAIFFSHVLDDVRKIVPGALMDERLRGRFSFYRTAGTFEEVDDGQKPEGVGTNIHIHSTRAGKRCDTPDAVVRIFVFHSYGVMDTPLSSPPV
jgi:hypothetical protein